VLLQKAFGLQVGDGGVVLVETGNQYTAWLRAGRVGENAAPTLVCIVADFTPIDTAENDGLAASEQGDPVNKQRVINLRGRGDAAAHASVA
jgi:hypothetical protein